MQTKLNHTLFAKTAKGAKSRSLWNLYLSCVLNNLRADRGKGNAQFCQLRAAGLPRRTRIRPSHPGLGYLRDLTPRTAGGLFSRGVSAGDRACIA
jgi:hypothetical protein